MAKFRITYEGVTPLIMHSDRLSDPFNPVVREMKKITAKKSKQTDEDRLEVARLEFLGGMYHDDALGPYMPSKNIHAGLLNSAALTRERPTFSRSIPTLDSLRYGLQYDGPRDIESLWGGGESPFVSRESVANQQARIMRTRPVFTEWKIEFAIEFDERELSADNFAEIAVRSGAKVGLGDWRPQKNGPYGRYAVTITEL